MQRLLFLSVATLINFTAISVGQAAAQPEGATYGPLIENYGPVVHVDGAAPIPAGTVFNVAFDVTEQGDAGAVNRRLETAARFLNMHAAAGVPSENLNVAIVVHGAAVKDLTHSAAYGGENANAGLIKALQENGVSVYVCGQSAAFRGVKAADLLPGVEMKLSAMTAHAQLQQQGYTLNPF